MKFVKITGPDFTKITNVISESDKNFKTTVGTFRKDTMAWIIDDRITAEFIKMSKILFETSPFHKLITPEDMTIRCTRCLTTYFVNNCPHCGSTFLKRDILRQTS